MGGNLLFFVAVSSMLAYEMDAIDKREWRLLFFLRRLRNDGVLRWFIVLHLPARGELDRWFVVLELVASSPSSGDDPGDSCGNVTARRR